MATEETAMVLLVNQGKAVVEVGTEVMDKVTVEVLAARSIKAVVKINTLVEAKAVVEV